MQAITFSKIKYLRSRVGEWGEASHMRCTMECAHVQEEKSSNKGRKGSQQLKRPRLDRTISAPLPAAAIDGDNSNSIFSILKY